MDKSKHPIKFPNIKIDISDNSNLDPHKPIIFMLPDESQINFYDSLEIFGNNFDIISMDLIQPNQLEIKIDNIENYKSPLEISNLKIYNNNLMNASKVNYKSINQYRMQILYDNHVFESNANLIVATPEISFKPKAVFWPMDQIVSNSIKLYIEGDTENKYFSNIRVNLCRNIY